MDEQSGEYPSTIDILKVSTDLQSGLIRKLNTQSNLQEIMTEIVDKTAEVLKASACTVFRLEPNNNRAIQLAGTGYQR